MSKKYKIICFFLLLLMCINLCVGCREKNTKELSTLKINIITTINNGIQDNIEKIFLIRKESKEIVKLLVQFKEVKPLGVQNVEEKEIPTEEDMKTYLSMSVEEIEKLTGNTICEDGSLVVFSFNVFFPCLYLDDTSFYFICISKEDKSWAPRYLSYYGGYRQEFLLTLGLSEDMNFENIMEVWGKTEIEVVERMDQKRYRISYERDRLIYEFISDNESGYPFNVYVALRTLEE